MKQKLQIPTKAKLLFNCFAAGLAGIAEKYTMKRWERRTHLQEGKSYVQNATLKAAQRNACKITEMKLPLLVKLAIFSAVSDSNGKNCN